jgi:hypothetical protein
MLPAAGAWLPSATPATDQRRYPVWCCNENDHREVDQDKGGTVLEVPDGRHLRDANPVLSLLLYAATAFTRRCGSRPSATSLAFHPQAPCSCGSPPSTAP